MDLENIKKEPEEKLVQNLKVMNSYDREVFGWDAPEFIKHEKTGLWFLIAGCFALLLVVYALYTNSWTFAVAILILSGVYFLYHHVEPNRVHISISETGIKIGENSFPYMDFAAFWIIYKPPFVKNLHLRLKKKFLGEMTIQLENENPVQIREFLTGKITELSGRDETMSELLIRTFKL
jgi:hypothetical protein